MSISINKTQAFVFISILIGLSLLAWKHQEKIAGVFGVSSSPTVAPMSNMLRTCKSFQNGSALAHYYGYATQGTLFDKSEE